MAHFLSRVKKGTISSFIEILLYIGLGMMMASSASGAPIFNLKAARDYFSNVKTLALLDAALAGNLSKAQQLVADGANPNDANFHNCVS